MDEPTIPSGARVTLVGGGALRAAQLHLARRHAPFVVAVDGGANHCRRLGVLPGMVVGDMDSIAAQTQRWVGAARLQRTPDQEATDFEKALRAVAPAAPLVLAVGFTGARLDHQLASLSVLARSPVPCVLIGAHDIVFAIKKPLQIALRKEDRFSLFPLRCGLRGRSKGLVWPIDGLEMSPLGPCTTSNRVGASGQVRVEIEGEGMLCLLPRTRLSAAIEALG